MTDEVAQPVELQVTDEFLNSEKFEKAIGKNVPYYRNAFRRMVENPKYQEIMNSAGALSNTWGWGKELKSRFNWPAAIFTAPWFAYRKMWKQAFILEVVYWVISYWAEKHFPLQNKFGGFNGAGVIVSVSFNILYSYFVGTYANSLYLRAFDEKLRDAAGDQDEYLIKTGTNIWGAITMVIIGTIAGILVSVLASK